VNTWAYSASTNSYSSLVQRLPVLCRWLVCSSFQSTCITRDDHTLSWASDGSQKEDQKLLQVSELHHQGEFWYLNVSVQWQLWQCNQNLCGPFLRAALPMKVKVNAWARVADGKTKALLTPAPRWVPAPIIHIWFDMTAIVMVQSEPF